MYTLSEVAKDIFLFRAHCNSIIYRYDGNKVAVIDTGIDKGFAKKLKTALDEENFTITHIINTHYHADHTGGNKYLCNKSSAAVYINGLEGDIIKNPSLNLRLLTGGCPMKKQSNKFFLSEGVDNYTDALPAGIIKHSFPGHSLDMSVFELPGGVFCMGDLYVEARILEKYKITHLCDIKMHLASLKAAKELDGKLFIPSHGDAVDNIKDILDFNIRNVEGIVSDIKNICKTALNIDEILKRLFDRYDIILDLVQHTTCMTTLRSYLAYLVNNNELECFFEGNRQLFITKSSIS